MMRNAAEHMGRRLDTAQLPEILLRNQTHPRWDDIADRCLACANCTLACPTCFCSNVEDTSDLTGDHAERWRTWGSCFTLEFSYHTGGYVRSSTRARYRQWMTHKLAGWHEQFGTSGCVGCGRCITWCPVGIDITEEARTLRAGEKEL
jgi:ferredoxin